MEERRVDERGRGWVAFGSLDPREQERFKSQMNLPTLLMAPERKPRLSLRPSNLTGVCPGELRTHARRKVRARMSPAALLTAPKGGNNRSV